MADFSQAFSKTLVHEGGYQNNPADHGNWYNQINYGTKYGITPQTFAKYFPDLISDPNCIRNLTVPQAQTCYRGGFWPELYDHINDQTFAEKLFDMGVLMGPGTAVKLAQISMHEDGALAVVTDGKFGPVTLAQVNAVGDLSKYRSVLLNHVMNIVNNDPSQAQFISGWITRINS